MYYVKYKSQHGVRTPEAVVSAREASLMTPKPHIFFKGPYVTEKEAVKEFKSMQNALELNQAS